MTRIKYLLALSFIVVLMLSAGCTTTVYSELPGSENYDEAVEFEPNPEAATVYVYRLGGDYSYVAYELSVDGQPIPTLAFSFVWLELPPGEHHLEAPATSTFGFTGEVTENFEAGEVYYYEMTFNSRIGIPDKTELLERQPLTAQNNIKNKLRLISMDDHNLNRDATPQSE
ncbi:DUF2846 domain-containing protein [Marinospirillum perlucidum]|uniref:DUF2846 domain-containing protein n=1 Tax=Marinospirillum perlucidum TaxID=1982602 RepID=UPI000DF11105|nr:DUF2846 domain-containing protein [Marinospirillum perlucidum]